MTEDPLVSCVFDGPNQYVPSDDACNGTGFHPTTGGGTTSTVRQGNDFLLNITCSGFGCFFLPSRISSACGPSSNLYMTGTAPVTASNGKPTFFLPSAKLDSVAIWTNYLKPL
eukprot:CAMPEP_0169115924 /NCGR_PEP_ID=MMETSP1015-20121227/29602_1 /TAXON_ID=342587 /ORGANISM="Karlodinium micrum, Strain CCMP2283" /LENGTH=112 /DNA_ID=CAMNT_0009178409 /DNA_START=183 /DNA_END=521 /DNA_ORIENTATION=+